MVLHIVSASYGRTRSNVCDIVEVRYKRRTNCGADCLAIVRGRCENRVWCKISASNNVFGDPCDDTVKYLEVSYQCKPSGGFKGE